MENIKGKVESSISNITNTGKLLVKGQIAANIHEIHSLAMSDILVNKDLDNLTVEELVSVLSIFTNIRLNDEDKYTDVKYCNVNKNIIHTVKKFVMYLDKYYDMETKYETNFSQSYNIQYDMCEFMYKWCFAENDEDCISLLRELFSFLPLNNMEDPPIVQCDDPIDRKVDKLRDIVPVNPNKPYDMKEVIKATVDNEYFFEVAENYAGNIVIGFARLNGKTVGIVGNQPNVLAGVLDIQSSIKGARFVRFCDCFNIPLLTFVDVPGFLPGVDQELNGIILHGAKLLYAYCEATVPRVTVITRKAYGGAYDVMSSKHIRGDINLAFPTAEIAVMCPDGAVNIVNRKEIQNSDDPVAEKERLVEEYKSLFANPYRAANLGFIDDVILPENTRAKVINAFEMLEGKRQNNPPKKHGLIPL